MSTYLQYFNQVRDNIIRSQSVDKQAAMAQWFDNLMNGIERNLLTKNRDRYSKEERMDADIYFDIF
jgi:exportin-7